jgi:adenylate kinase family enzyme
MERVPIILIVGKPGAGKSTLGQALARALGAEYRSVGGFIREVLGIPDPHMVVDKKMVFKHLHEHLQDGGAVVLDCHPYPEDYYKSLMHFAEREPFYIRAILEVQVPDDVARTRLASRPRPGDPIDVRLKYYNDHLPYIQKLMAHPRALVVDNSESRTDTGLSALVDDILKRLPVQS